MDMVDVEYFSEHIQCSRTDKQDCMPVLEQLMELANHAHTYGLLELDRLIQDNLYKYGDTFLRKAISAIVDIGDRPLTRRILMNYILCGNYSGPQFLKNMVIAETALCIQADVPMDHTFLFLVPSYFGLEFEPNIIQLYRSFKISKGLTFDDDIIYTKPEAPPPSVIQPNQ